MKTDIDPLFEQKDSRDFGKQFAIEVTVILTTSFVIALLFILLYFKRVIDDVDPVYQLAILCVPGVAYLIYRLRKQLEDFKHNDQR